MGIFSKAKKKGELALVFNLGSSSVGGALFEMEKNGVPRIILAFREPITLEMTVDADKFLSSTLKSLEIVTNKIFTAKIGAPKRIFCVLSSPWHVSQTRVIKLEKEIPFIFTSKLADSLIQKEISLFEEEYLKKNSTTENLVQSIEFKNIKTMLNGYETSNPLNQKVRDLEMSVFISISPKQVLNEIEEIIGKYFHSLEIKFSSFAVASFTVVRDMYVNDDSFLLIDIGGEVTDILMVKKNALRESASFPLGVNFVIRGLASALNSTLDEAKSSLFLFKEGHAIDSVARKIEPILNKLKMDWLRKFQESLANLSNDISIPATIYITADKELAEFFRQMIEIEQFNQYSFTESKFKISFLGAEVFHGMAVFEENIIRDPALVIDSIYINRFLG